MGRFSYESFLSTLAQNHWRRIGLKRRAGVAAPLFSVYSERSTGIGELPDLKLLADWAGRSGFSILQLLPMNDVGFSFGPYDGLSTFALEPMYLSPAALVATDLKPFRKKLESLRERFSTKTLWVDYAIKQAKLDFFWEVFKEAADKKDRRFRSFVKSQGYWLEDYALFKVIKEQMEGRDWEHWSEETRSREPSALERFKRGHPDRFEFYEWLQWQLFEQFREVKKYAAGRGVLLMGDLPFLVSRDSADVWAHPHYFKLGRTAGAPPDLYIAKGQRWGMPPYAWEKMAQEDDRYLVEKIRYASHFYDFFRIDHAVGIFRIWTIALSDPPETAGLNGHFDPADESLWENQGRVLLSRMIQASDMMPCAEDLGVIPECSYRVLEEFGIPGMEVQRWTKDWGKTYDFRKPGAYRKNSIAVLSSHDTSSLGAWWEFEAGTLDQDLFIRRCDAKGISFGQVKDKLFDAEKSQHGRLRWRKDIPNGGALAMILQRPQDQIPDFLDMYLGSYREKEKFWSYLGLAGPLEEKTSPRFARAAVQKVHESASIFSIHLLQDWLALGDFFDVDLWEYRINFPGVARPENWRLRMPFSLEEILKLQIHPSLKALHEAADRS